MNETRGAESERRPEGELMIRMSAMPADANPMGDIFGGWLLSHMDLAGGEFAVRRARGRTATVAIDAMQFYAPVRVGDMLCCYVRIKRIGTTSMAIWVEAWAERRRSHDAVLVTEGMFTYVALDDDGRPRPVPPDEP